MRYLGVDYGTKKIGLALSDEGGTMGFPHDIIANTPRLLGDLCALIARENVGAVVIGESRTLAGADNAIAAEAHALGDALAEQCGAPIAYESEVYTSAQARRLPEEPHFTQVAKGNPRKSRAPLARGAVDASAAALILTSYLSRQHGI